MTKDAVKNVREGPVGVAATRYINQLMEEALCITNTSKETGQAWQYILMTRNAQRLKKQHKIAIQISSMDMSLSNANDGVDYYAEGEANFEELDGQEDCSDKKERNNLVTSTPEHIKIGDTILRDESDVGLIANVMECINLIKDEIDENEEYLGQGDRNSNNPMDHVNNSLTNGNINESTNSRSANQAEDERTPPVDDLGVVVVADEQIIAKYDGQEDELSTIYIEDNIVENILRLSSTNFYESMNEINKKIEAYSIPNDNSDSSDDTKEAENKYDFNVSVELNNVFVSVDYVPNIFSAKDETEGDKSAVEFKTLNPDPNFVTNHLASNATELDKWEQQNEEDIQIIESTETIKKHSEVGLYERTFLTLNRDDDYHSERDKDDDISEERPEGSMHEIELNDHSFSESIGEDFEIENRKKVEKNLTLKRRIGSWLRRLLSKRTVYERKHNSMRSVDSLRRLWRKSDNQGARQQVVMVYMETEV